ncbi:Sec-independent protein translocase subunit TatA, partial [Cellulosimicrobium funkei]
MNILRHPATIVVLILLVLLLFGSKRLPDMARSVGQSLKIFKKEVKDLREDDDTTTTTTPSGTTATTSTGTT